jgi:hypothetical protein
MTNPDAAHRSYPPSEFLRHGIQLAENHCGFVVTGLQPNSTQRICEKKSWSLRPHRRYIAKQEGNLGFQASRRMLKCATENSKKKRKTKLLLRHYAEKKNGVGDLAFKNFDKNGLDDSGNTFYYQYIAEFLKLKTKQKTNLCIDSPCQNLSNVTAH